jgi:hypothetical protein
LASRRDVAVDAPRHRNPPVDTTQGEIKLLEDDRSGLSADDLDPEELLKAKRWIAKAGWGFTLLIVVIWPVLSTPAGVFTKDYFAFWIFIAVIWALVASFIIIVLPIWESKDQILAVFDGIFHTNLCEYYNPETSKQHKLHQAAAAAEPAKAADPVS